jgi:hypothetical protein
LETRWLIYMRRPIDRFGCFFVCVWLAAAAKGCHRIQCFARIGFLIREEEVARSEEERGFFGQRHEPLDSGKRVEIPRVVDHGVDRSIEPVGEGGEKLPGLTNQKQKHGRFTGLAISHRAAIDPRGRP